MCYAIPARIESLQGDDAVVDYGGIRKSIKTSLVDDIREGDYVLIHAGFAIEKLDKASAEDALIAIRKDMEQIRDS